MSRDTRTDFPGAFRVVLTNKAGEITYYIGPYQTLGAAKGMLTRETSSYWNKNGSGYIERTTGAWEKVEN